MQCYGNFVNTKKKLYKRKPSNRDDFDEKTLLNNL